MLCKNCGGNIPDGMNFCQNCGMKIDFQPSTDSKQTYYNNSNSAENTFFSGANYQNSSFGNGFFQTPNNKRKKVRNKGKSNLLWLKIGIPTVCVVLAIVFALFNPFFGIISKKDLKTAKEEEVKRNSDYFLYLKDNNIFCMDTDELKSIPITTSFIDKEGDIRRALSDYQDHFFTFNDEGNLLFYFDEINDYGGSLYCRDLSEDDEEKAVQKIDSDVVRFAISDDGENIFYIKYGDCNLYWNNLTEKNKLASSVSNFCINSDGSRLIYVTDEEDIYLVTDFENKELIDRESIIYLISEDLSEITYTKDGSLFYKEISKEKVKIDTDVTNVLGYSGDKTFYYEKTIEEEVYYTDYINNDIDFSNYQAPYDIEKPDWDDYYFKYDDYDKAEEEYDKDYKEYEKRYNDCLEKQDAYDFYSDLADETFTYVNRSICYYDGNKSIDVAGDVNNYCFPNSNVVFYECFDRSSIKKVNLSEIYENEDKYSIRSAFYKEGQNYIAVCGNKLELESIYSCDISADGNTVYYLVNSDNNEYYGPKTLYKATIANNKPENKEKVADDVYDMDILGKNGDLYTLRNASSTTGYGDLYCNDTKVDFDVDWSSLKTTVDENYICYLSGIGKSKSGTLNIFDGKEKTKVFDDAVNYLAIDKDKIFFLGDYSTERKHGTLYYYNGKETKVADQDNTDNIINVSSNSERRADFIDNINVNYIPIQSSSDDGSYDYD